MTSIIVLLCIALLAIVLVQIGKVTELTNLIKGESETLRENSKWNGWLSVGFMVVFLVSVCYSAYHFKNVMMGYGPHKSASVHGEMLDDLFNVTLFFTGIVFVLTHIALFWFPYKYQMREGQKVKYIPHDNRLEVWWTVVPAIVLTILVIRGLSAWNAVMADVGAADSEVMEIEATAQQFGWTIRYPGPDGKLGARDFHLCKDANALLGLDFTDAKSHDDIVTSAVGDPIMLPLGKKIRVRIIAKDVLHNFDLPHFRVKMDAVPGMPTYFVFTPRTSTAQYREQLRPYPEYNEPYDPEQPLGPKRWEKFEYELACAELCGKGHYSMRRIVKIVSPEEFEAWYKLQQSYYLNEIRDKKGDPNIGKVLPIEVGTRKKAFGLAMERAMTAANEAEKTLTLNHIYFETGSATLSDDSKYELENCVEALTKYPNASVEISGHTDNSGDAAANRALSQARAQSVATWLAGKGISAGRLKTVGFGDTKPAAPNDSPENMAKNRRIEFRIL